MASAKRRGARYAGAEPRDTVPPVSPALPAGPPIVGRLEGAFWVPALFTLALLGLSFLPRIAEQVILARSFWGAGALLLGWQALYYFRAKGSSVRPELLFTAPRRQHYIQAFCQLAVYAYWGWYWRPVYDFAPLLLGQLLFAYAFDIILQWWRKGSYSLGMGPFPIIFSINLFLWFRDDWFFLQFLMLAVGFMGKEYVRWSREGRLTHIFNPSAFALGLFSVVLIATGTSDLTWGQDIASTLSLAPRIYLFLFLVGLVVMYFFSITLVAASAAAVLFGLSALHSWWSGVPYFLDTEIPTAVFLGLHLLVTDPSTSPRTPAGKLAFGSLYGIGVFALYALLGTIGSPTFYDKLLIVPFLNLSVRWIDRMVQRAPRQFILGRIWPSWTPARMNVVHIGLWVGFFALMTVTGRTDGVHPGDRLPFWVEACEEGRRTSCERLIQLEYAYCADGSGWACGELGRHLAEGRITEGDPELALGYLSRGCELRFQPACVNLLRPGEDLITADPRPLDLRFLLREGGANLVETPEPELYSRGCEHGWSFACGRLSGVL